MTGQSLVPNTQRHIAVIKVDMIVNNVHTKVIDSRQSLTFVWQSVCHWHMTVTNMTATDTWQLSTHDWQPLIHDRCMTVIITHDQQQLTHDSRRHMTTISTWQPVTHDQKPLTQSQTHDSHTYMTTNETWQPPAHDIQWHRTVTYWHRPSPTSAVTLLTHNSRWHTRVTDWSCVVYCSPSMKLWRTSMLPWKLSMASLATSQCPFRGQPWSVTTQSLRCTILSWLSSLSDVQNTQVSGHCTQGMEYGHNPSEQMP